MTMRPWLSETYTRLMRPVRGSVPVTSARSAAPSAAGLYPRIVLDDLLREREATLARLRLQGVHTLDLASAEVTASVLNRYLEMRYSSV